MNRKASNSENAAREKSHPGKSGSECDSARKENLEHGGDMEPPIEGMVFRKYYLYPEITRISKMTQTSENF